MGVTAPGACSQISGAYPDRTIRVCAPRNIGVPKKRANASAPQRNAIIPEGGSQVRVRAMKTQVVNGRCGSGLVRVRHRDVLRLGWC
ncbi:protein of unknown function [Pseudomonas mediterranea]